MKFELPEFPYGIGDLEPHLTARTLEFHYDQAIVWSFGSFPTFQEEFITGPVGVFGSGYVWLTFDPEQERVAIEPMKDAESPLLVERIPLLGMDVWEDAYYPDYQNARQRCLEAFLSHLANWRFANENLETCVPKGGS